MTDDHIKQQYTNPEWGKGGSHCHDWRKYVSKEVRALWDTFTDEQKRALHNQAQDIADAEIWD